MNLFSETALFSLFLGIGLSVSVGFRVFLPLFLISLLASLNQNFVTIADDMIWITDPNFMVLFGIAALVEVGVFFVPFLDNKLDRLKIPFSIIAGIILFKSIFLSESNAVNWILSLLIGGGVAGLVSYTIAIVRNITSTTTNGVGNFLVNMAEIIVAILLSITAILFSPLAFVIAAILIYLMVRSLNRLKRDSLGNLKISSFSAE